MQSDSCKACRSMHESEGVHDVKRAVVHALSAVCNRGSRAYRLGSKRDANQLHPLKSGCVLDNSGLCIHHRVRSMSTHAGVIVSTQIIHEGSFGVMYTLRLMHATLCYTIIGLNLTGPVYSTRVHTPSVHNSAPTNTAPSSTSGELFRKSFARSQLLELLPQWTAAKVALRST